MTTYPSLSTAVRAYQHAFRVGGAADAIGSARLICWTVIGIAGPARRGSRCPAAGAGRGIRWTPVGFAQRMTAESLGEGATGLVMAILGVSPIRLCSGC